MRRFAAEITPSAILIAAMPLTPPRALPPDADAASSHAARQLMPRCHVCRAASTMHYAAAAASAMFVFFSLPRRAFCRHAPAFSRDSRQRTLSPPDAPLCLFDARSVIRDASAAAAPRRHAAVADYARHGAIALRYARDGPRARPSCAMARHAAARERLRSATLRRRPA